MKEEDFYKTLRSGSFYPVYILQGHPFFIEEAWKSLLSELNRRYKKLTTKRLSAKTVEENDFIEFIRTLPLGFDVKAVFLSELHKAKESFIKALINYMERPNKKTFLVIAIEQEVKPFKTLEERIAKGDILWITFNTPKIYQLPQWIKNRLKSFGKEISIEGAQVIANAVGTDFFAIQNEIEKLLLYLEDKRVITTQDLEFLLSSKRLYSIFEIMDFVAQGKPKEALKELEDLFNSGEQPIAFLGLIARHVRLLWQVKSAKKDNLSFEEIKEFLKIPDFLVERLIKQSELFSEKKLRRLHKELYETDYKLKTTFLSPLHLISRLIMMTNREFTEF